MKIKFQLIRFFVGAMPCACPFWGVFTEFGQAQGIVSTGLSTKLKIFDSIFFYKKTRYIRKPNSRNISPIIYFRIKNFRDGLPERCKALTPAKTLDTLHSSLPLLLEGVLAYLWLIS